MDYSWTGALPQDLDKFDQLIKLGETYHAQDDKLQVLFLAAIHHKERWVNVPPLGCRTQLLADIHNDLAYCGRNKLLNNMHKWFW